MGFSGQGLDCRRGERMVFRGLDFALEAGGALVLSGPNGSGKSSLLRVMAGLLPPVAGALAWDKAPVALDFEAHRARTHYVGHLDAVKPVLTVLENLVFWSGLRHDDQSVVHEAARAALDAFGILGLADFPGRFLSAGQKRRLGLARILAAPAPLWLLDEPTVALDRHAVGVFEGIIARHRATGGMVVVSTHTDIALPGAASLDLAAFSRPSAQAA